MKFQLKRRPFITGSILLLLAVILSSSGCEPFAPIVIENQTSETLSISINDKYIGDVEPKAEMKNKKIFLAASDYNIEARNAQGDIIYSKKLSFEDMEKINWKLVIQPL